MITAFKKWWVAQNIRHAEYHAVKSERKATSPFRRTTHHLNRAETYSREAGRLRELKDEV